MESSYYHSSNWEVGTLQIEAIVTPYERSGHFDEPPSGGEVEIISLTDDQGKTMTVDEFLQLENELRQAHGLSSLTFDYVYDQLVQDVLDQEHGY